MLTLLSNFKKMGDFFPDFVAFSQYLNFTSSYFINLLRQQRRVGNVFLSKYFELGSRVRDFFKLFGFLKISKLWLNSLIFCIVAVDTLLYVKQFHCLTWLNISLLILLSLRFLPFVHLLMHVQCTCHVLQIYWRIPSVQPSK